MLIILDASERDLVRLGVVSSKLEDKGYICFFPFNRSSVNQDRLKIGMISGVTLMQTREMCYSTPPPKSLLS